MIPRIAESLILFLFATIAHPPTTNVGEHFFAGVAQLVEQLIRNQQASGSSPLAGFLFNNLTLSWPVYSGRLDFRNGNSGTRLVCFPIR